MIIMHQTQEMARAFTTEFTYHNKTYTAVISQVDGHISVYVPDDSLHDILPKGKASVNPVQGIKVNTPHLTAEQDLLLCILSALDIQINCELK